MVIWHCWRDQWISYAYIKMGYTSGAEKVLLKECLYVLIKVSTFGLFELTCFWLNFILQNGRLDHRSAVDRMMTTCGIVLVWYIMLCIYPISHFGIRLAGESPGCMLPPCGIPCLVVCILQFWYYKKYVIHVYSSNWSYLDNTCQVIIYNSISNHWARFPPCCKDTYSNGSLYNNYTLNSYT